MLIWFSLIDDILRLYLNILTHFATIYFQLFITKQQTSFFLTFYVHNNLPFIIIEMFYTIEFIVTLSMYSFILYMKLSLFNFYFSHMSPLCLCLLIYIDLCIY